jgi:hypothetical protein
MAAPALPEGHPGVDVLDQVRVGRPLLGAHFTLEAGECDSVDKLAVEDLHDAALAIANSLVSRAERAGLTELTDQLEGRRTGRGGRSS